jgi:beta-lactamase superfamily II metal-dependent hydrolase
MRRFVALTVLLLLLLLSFSGCDNRQPSNISKTTPMSQSAAGSRVAIDARFVDVGQGDCEILKIAQGSSTFFALVDTGDRQAYPRIASKFSSLGCNEINVLVLTHPDADHVGSARDILNNYRVDRVWQSGFTKNTEAWQDTSATIDAKQIPSETVQKGKQDVWNGATVKVLNPMPQTFTDSNNASVVLLVSVGDKDILLMGDAENEAQENMTQDTLPKVEVYKVPHHGSAGAYYPPFLNAIHPDYSVIEVGAGNSYGHPQPEVVQALIGIGSMVYRTDQNGDVDATVTPDSTTVKSER